jgi:hypothetical protein
MTCHVTSLTESADPAEPAAGEKIEHLTVARRPAASLHHRRLIATSGASVCSRTLGLFAARRRCRVLGLVLEHQEEKAGTIGGRPMEKESER